MRTPPVILVVEDNAEMRAFIRGRLEATYRVRESANGEEALASIAEQVPDPT